jgi:V8-like Glu-specific endopeptidase
VKRFAPGEIDRALGSAADGTGETVFAHDATTLGGNSGSCVVDLGNDGRLVVGLHFAGIPKHANYAHANARLRAQLADLGFTWKAWI